jgi:hypothetical protein
MTISSTNIRFLSSDRAEVLGQIVEISARRDGKAWFDLVPYVHEEDLAPESSLVKAFSAKGPPIPRGTFIPPVERRGRVQPGRVGLEHPTGRYAVRRLGEIGIYLPEGFITKQDHARRGLVFEVDPDVSPELILDFLLDAAAALAEVPVGERWIGKISEQI